MGAVHAFDRQPRRRRRTGRLADAAERGWPQSRTGRGRAGIRHRFLKGNHPTVACIEREYRTGTLDVLLVNTSNYGSGLNFENTTDVVMLHKFDTDIEHQVIGRAPRCGRTTPLNVWYLLHDNEIVNHPE